MRTAIIVHNTSPGGVQRVGITEAAILSKKGHRTTLVSILKPKNEFDILRKLDVKVLYLLKGNEVLGRALHNVMIDRAIVTIIKNLSFEADVLIANNIPGALVALKIANYIEKRGKKRPRIILYLHDPLTYPIAGSFYSIYAKYFPSVMLRLEERIIQKVNIILTNSRRTLLKLNKIHGNKYTSEKAYVLYPTVNKPLKEKEIKGERKRYLLIVGRLDHEAFYNLYKIMKRLDIPLVIAGSFNPYNISSRTILRLFMHLRRRGKNIKFILNPSDDTLLDLYRKAALFVYPGHENFNMSAIEAMSAGTPILVADITGICEILPNKLREKLCLNKNNIKLWIEKIQDIIENNKSYKLGRECWKITNNYNLKTHTNKLVDILEGIVG